MCLIGDGVQSQAASLHFRANLAGFQEYEQTSAVRYCHYQRPIKRVLTSFYRRVSRIKPKQVRSGNALKPMAPSLHLKQSKGSHLSCTTPLHITCSMINSVQLYINTFNSPFSGSWFRHRYLL